MKYLLILFSLSSVLAAPNPNFEGDLLNSDLYKEGDDYAKNCINTFLKNFVDNDFESAVGKFNADKYNEDSKEYETCEYLNRNYDLLDKIYKTYDPEYFTD